MRLGQREAAALLAARHRGQEIFLLLRGPLIRDDERHDQMAINYACEAHPSARKFLHHARIAEEAQPQPSVLDGDRGAEQPEFLHRGDQSMRIFIGVFEFRCGRDHVALDEASYRGDNVFICGFIHLKFLNLLNAFPPATPKGQRFSSHDSRCRIPILVGVVRERPAAMVYSLQPFPPVDIVTGASRSAPTRTARSILKRWTLRGLRASRCIAS